MSLNARSTRWVRLLLLLGLILLLRRLPARMLLVLVEASGAIFLVGGGLYLWYRVSKALARGSDSSKLK